MKNKPRQYTDEFKRDALRLLERSGKNMAEIEPGYTARTVGSLEKEIHY